MDRHAVGERRARKPGEVSGRVNARAVVGEHAPEEAAARRLAFERRFLEHDRRFTEQLAAILLLRAQALHPRGAMCEVQPARLRVVGIGCGSRGRACDERVRLDARVVQRLAGSTVLALERGNIAPNARMDHPGVSPARSLPQCATVNDDHVLAVRCHSSGRSQTGEARTDDDSVSGRGERGFDQCRERGVVPPERRLAIVLGEWRGPRARRTGGCPEAHNLLNSDKFDRVGQRTCCLHPVVSRSVSAWTTSASAR